MTQQFTEDQKRQIRDSRTRAMLDHGVGLPYHTRSLAQVKNGERLVSWIDGEAKGEVAKGSGVTFIGRGIASRDAAILTARGLNLRGIETYVVNLTSIVRWIEDPARGGERWRNMREAPVLVLTGLIEGAATPLTHWQTRDLQDHLVHRIEGGQAVCPVIEVPFLQAKGWYSEPFTELVTHVNQDFIV